MAGRLKHAERSHYSYRNSNESVFVGFAQKARIKSAQQPKNMGILSEVGAKIRKAFHRDQSK